MNRLQARLRQRPFWVVLPLPKSSNENTRYENVHLEVVALLLILVKIPDNRMTLLFYLKFVFGAFHGKQMWPCFAWSF